MNKESKTPDKPDQKSPAALKEEEVLAFWQENKIFEKSVEKDAPNGEFVFYDGPPFATGLPHYGSLLSSVIKDVIPRYKTMRGFRVRRRWGWDCHGLPIESMIEKDLGLKSKKDIEEMGVQKFNEACAAKVLMYTHEWKGVVERIGRWVEFDNAYKTMDPEYIQSVWWALKQINEKGLLYEGRKVLLYCPHCETPLAKAEIAMDNSYKDITEEAVTVKFKVKDPKKHNLPENTFLLAWTTTPWTLPANVGLAVNNEIEYALLESPTSVAPVTDVKIAREYYLVAKNKKLLADPVFLGILGTMDSMKGIDVSVDWDAVSRNLITKKGNDLIGIEYESLFDIPAISATGKKSHYVMPGDFVTDTDGTGVVHTAVIYGEDDYNLGLKNDLPMVPLLNANGTFNNNAPKFIVGQYYKKAEKLIKEDLENRLSGSLLFAKNHFTHSYPHCYRCGTALIYNALSSWFINIQNVKEKLIARNEQINWYPENLKHGRFLNIVSGAPDWNISRNRYWASPLPFWKCDKCNKTQIVGSLEELQKHVKSSGNRYVAIRHGFAQSNENHLISTKIDSPYHLTEEGTEKVKQSAKKVGKVDLIFASPLIRTKETAKILAKEIGFDESKIIYDDRLIEFQLTALEGHPWKEYDDAKRDKKFDYTRSCEGCETKKELKRRVAEFLFDIDSKYKDKKILVVSHGSPLRCLEAITLGLTETQAAEFVFVKSKFDVHAEPVELSFKKYPINANYELDFHRPYIDLFTWSCDCGGEYKRITEVIDCWVESGSMPFAELSYPFQNKELLAKRLPADFVAEYIPQTRTWFNYMHDLSNILFDSIAFKNVVATGTILAADGAKMSKSKGNYTDPVENINKFGADALRFYMMQSVVMQGEDLRFSELELREIQNKIVGTLSNVVSFYEMYVQDVPTNQPFSLVSLNNVLDKWIVALFNETLKAVTVSMDSYDTVRACRAIRDFINDLSTWYLRRSRDRFKSENEVDKQQAIKTSRFILIELSKIMAPFTPFIADYIYKQLANQNSKESVHLETWPEKVTFNPDVVASLVLASMHRLREVCSKALEARATAGIKVRQPLQSLTIGVELLAEYLEILKDEINVKEITFDSSLGDTVILNTTISKELKEEGEVRELIRKIQETRKANNFEPKDIVKATIVVNGAGQALVKKFEIEIRKVCGLNSIDFSSGEVESLFGLITLER